MSFSLILLMDLVGTVAFAFSGVMLAIRQKMDIFGIHLLAIVTATGGGALRDLLLGITPPVMFQNPLYVLVAALTANMIFILLRLHVSAPRILSRLNEELIFLFDTLGLAAFTMDGVLIGVQHGFAKNLFLLVFLGCITGVGGGILRDLLANRTPDVLVKHVYAVASILGGLICCVSLRITGNETISVSLGASSIILLRVLSAHFRWNLPRIED